MSVQFQPPLSRGQVLDAIEAIERAVDAGAVYPLPKGTTGRSALAEASAALGLSRRAVRNRLAAAGRFGLAGRLPAAPAPAKKSARPPSDVVAVQRLRDENARLRRAQAELARRAGKAEDLRGQVFGIASDPLPPVAFPRRDGASPHAETIVLFLSDLHWGEVADLAALDGLNSYNLPIARARLGRWAQTVADLSTRHWTGPPPERIVLILGGDMISGEIHAELAKTNEAKALPAVRDLVAHLAAALRLIRERVGCPVDVISLPGNHGRATMKPESKQAAETSYDTLVADFLESAFAAEKGVTFYKPVSGDALFRIYNFQIFATHGDRIGSRGGTGFIGPAATAARGFKRIAADYAARGTLLDLILIGHFHTPLKLEEGFVNGCLPGPTEYSRDGRFRPHPAQQLFLTIHPRRGVTQHRWVHVGAPEEGSLYAPRLEPPAGDLPRYRVPAVMERVP